MNCPNCKQTDRFQPWEGEVERAGVTFLARGDKCECGEILFDYEEAGRHSRIVADAIVERGIHSGAELKLVRKVAGLKATELAALVGVRPETVSAWETGKGALPPTVAYVVADLYERPRKARARLEAIKATRASA